MEIDNISIEDGNLYIHLNWLLFEDSEKGIFVGIIPTLNIAAKSDQVQKLADELNGMVKHFFEYYSDEKLERELLRKGWNNFSPPEDINVPILFLYCKTDVKEIDMKIMI
jgi:hypothetical protein